MSMTYTTPETGAGRVETDGEVFVPSFARTRRNSKKPVKTWMILAPIGAVVVLGAVGVMLMGGGDEAAAPRVAEPQTAVAQPLAAQAPMDQVETPVAPVEAAPAVEPAPAPVARRAAAPARSAPRAAPAPVVREEAPPEPTGPRPYSAAPSASNPTAPAIQTAPLNSAPATPQATPPTPAISVQPLN